MGIRHLLEKATIEGLDPREREEYLQFMEQTEHTNGLVSSWVRPGESKVGAHGLSGNPYLGATNLVRYQTQTIANGTETPIDWDTFVKMGEVKVDVDDTTKILLPTQNTLYGVIGRAVWIANSTGYRGLHMQFYDENDVNLWGETLHGIPGMYESITIPFCSGIWAPAASYFKMTVIQTSGGNLGLDYVDCTIFTMNTERK